MTQQQVAIMNTNLIKQVGEKEIIDLDLLEQSDWHGFCVSLEYLIT